MKAHISDKQPMTKERLLKMMSQAVRVNKDLWFVEGEKVTLDTARIIGRKDWMKKNPKYKEFVTSSADKVFTVHFEEKYAKNHVLACLIEDTNDPKWLFWVGDFKRVKDGKDT